MCRKGVTFVRGFGLRVGRARTRLCSGPVLLLLWFGCQAQRSAHAQVRKLHSLLGRRRWTDGHSARTPTVWTSPFRSLFDNCSCLPASLPFCQAFSLPAESSSLNLYPELLFLGQPSATPFATCVPSSEAPLRSPASLSRRLSFGGSSPSVWQAKHQHEYRESERDSKERSACEGLDFEVRAPWAKVIQLSLGDVLLPPFDDGDSNLP